MKRYQILLWSDYGDFKFTVLKNIYKYLGLSILIIYSKSYVSNMFQGSTIKKNCSTTEEHFVNLLDDQDKSKFFVWIENNFGNHEVEDIGSPDCCAKSNFVWNSISLTWEPNTEI